MSALAEDRLPHGSCMISEEKEDSSESSNGVSKSASIVSSGADGAKGYICCRGSNSSYQPEETESMFKLQAVECYESESLFSFQQSSSSLVDNSNYNQKENLCVWGDDLNHFGYQWNQVTPKYNAELRLQQDFGCFQTASSFCGSNTGNQQDQWFFSGSTHVTDTQLNEQDQAHEPVLHKRPSTEESTQPQKKQCSGNASKKQKQTKPSPSKDPQSIAAKNRRERISERLKVLKELVPNGSKVDLVTMLEKAISYVKFLQLQVKVLATDEFWPVLGGKDPDISQVKEAIDAIILASRKERNAY